MSKYNQYKRENILVRRFSPFPTGILWIILSVLSSLILFSCEETTKPGAIYNNYEVESGKE